MEVNSNGSSTNQTVDAHDVDLLILGSGPAGSAAALYAARAQLNPIVLGGIDFHGQVALTNIVENYPGFPDGVGGAELGDLFQKQAEKFGARFEYDAATEVYLDKRPFEVKTYNGIYHAKSLIIATGASPNHLNTPGESELTGRGVSYCATCDGWFFKNKEVAVVGGGDSALEEGLFLTRYASSVTIIHRRDALRAGAILQTRAKENPKIHFLWNSVVTGIVGNEKVEGLQVKDVVSEEVSPFKTDGIFIFIGHTPNSAIFKGQVNMDERGYINTNKLMQTNIPGVFAAGEITDPDYRQVITSAGMGAAAAIQAVRYLEN
jgi:thioredoxin reductase (NADPH)